MYVYFSLWFREATLEGRRTIVNNRKSMKFTVILDTPNG